MKRYSLKNTVVQSIDVLSQFTNSDCIYTAFGVRHIKQILILFVRLVLRNEVIYSLSAILRCLATYVRIENERKSSNNLQYIESNKYYQ